MPCLRRCAALASFVCAALTLTAAPARAQLILDSTGRTISPLPVIAGSSFDIQLSHAPEGAVDCHSQRPEAGGLVIKYRVMPVPVAPLVLGVDDRTATSVKEGYRIADMPSGARFVVFNVWEGSREGAAALTQLDDCVKGWRSAIDAMAPLEHALELARDTAQKAADTLSATRKEVTAATDDMKAFQGTASDAAVAQLVLLQKKVQDLRARASKEEAADVAAKKAVAKAEDGVAEAVDANGGTSSELKERADRVSDYAAAKRRDPDYQEAVVLKVGGLLVGGRVRTVAYDLTSRTSENSVAISPMGTYPIVRYGDELYAVLLNVVDGTFSAPFRLQATAQAGVVVNLEPIRPVFEAGAVRAGEASADRPSKVVLAATVYRDVFLPVIGSFAPNDYPKVTIATDRMNADKKFETLTLVNEARYPQFRANYRFNFNSGVMRSSLRTKTFTKVRTADDDEGTEKVDESRYRIAEQTGAARILPIFAFTTYLRPVDIQSPVSWAERIIPNPTIGFAFTNPADDIFVGFSHDVLRNLQFFYGAHFGVVHDLQARNDVSEEQDSSAPATRDKRRGELAFGLSLNVNVIAKVFGK